MPQGPEPGQGDRRGQEAHCRTQDLMPQGAAERKRLEWRCRRGTRELDMLVTAYLRQCYETACASDRQTFERLLEMPDPELYDLLIGRAVHQDGALNRVADAVRAA